MAGPNKVTISVVKAPETKGNSVSHKLVASNDGFSVPIDCDMARLPEMAFKGLNRFYVKAEQARRDREQAKTPDQRFLEGSMGMPKFIDSKIHLIDDLPRVPKMAHGK